MRFLRFYWNVLDQALTDWQTIHDKLILFASALASVCAFINRPFMTTILKTSEGISPKWGFAPILALVLGRLMWANYEQYSKLKSSLTELQDQESERMRNERIYDELALLLMDGDRLADRQVADAASLERFVHDLGRWQGVVQACLAVANSGVTDAILFLSTPTEEPLEHGVATGFSITIAHTRFLRTLNENRANLRSLIERYLREKTDLGMLEAVTKIRRDVLLRKQHSEAFPPDDEADRL